jgi:hypothetical protein
MPCAPHPLNLSALLCTHLHRRRLCPPLHCRRLCTLLHRRRLCPPLHRRRLCTHLHRAGSALLCTAAGSTLLCTATGSTLLCTSLLNLMFFIISQSFGYLVLINQLYSLRRGPLKWVFECQLTNLPTIKYLT